MQNAKCKMPATSRFELCILHFAFWILIGDVQYRPVVHGRVLFQRVTGWAGVGGSVNHNIFWFAYRAIAGYAGIVNFDLGAADQWVIRTCTLKCRKFIQRFPQNKNTVISAGNRFPTVNWIKLKVLGAIRIQAEVNIDIWNFRCRRLFFAWNGHKENHPWKKEQPNKIF